MLKGFGARRVKSSCEFLRRDLLEVGTRAELRGIGLLLLLRSVGSMSLGYGKCWKRGEWECVGVVLEWVVLI